jgi:hypothetical protein
MKSPINPSRKATARVKNPLPTPEQCRYCGSEVSLRTHFEVYGRNYSEWPWVYQCGNPSCAAHIGIHPFTNIPLGTLANAELRTARKLAKQPFNRIWESGRMSRRDAYLWLARKLEINASECHFGWFSLDRCTEAKKICEEFLK